MPDGEHRRFTYDWGDGIQVTGGAQIGFYLGEGYASYSGSLDPSIEKSRIEFTGDMREGEFWFFHHGFPEADGGVGVTVPCRVFRVR